MKVTFANTKRTDMFFNIEGGTVFMDDEDEVFIKGSDEEGDEDNDLAINIRTGKIAYFLPNTLVYPLPTAELIIK
jgi:hypothetical protein